jgi:hypothetical protein
LGTVALLTLDSLIASILALVESSGKTGILVT